MRSARRRICSAARFYEAKELSRVEKGGRQTPLAFGNILAKAYPLSTKG